jgi:ATP-dependent exoDNAse (exonuclease V) beta subunit
MTELEAEAREPDAPIELAGREAIRLMTIHAAKGLEFPVVVVADLGRDRPGQAPEILVDGDRVGIRVVPMHGPSVEALDYAALKEERADEGRAEERRVFHVAVTRAEERLILSGGVCTAAWPRVSDTCAPIVWLATTLVPGLAARLEAGETRFAEGGVQVVVQRPTDDVTAAAAAAVAVAVVAPAEPEGHVREPRALPAPAPGTRTLSYSTLGRHAACGYRFYLERVLGLPPQDPPPAGPREEAPPVVEGIDPMLRGTLAHALLEHLDLGSPEVPDATAVRARAALHDAQPTDAEVADLQRLVGAAVEGDLLARVRRAERVHREEGFALALGADHHAAPLLNGVLDVLAWEAGGSALVVDYKTDRLDGADPEAVVEASYAVQRRIYALAALRAGAPRVEVAHLFLEAPDRPAVAVYSAEQAGALEAEVVAHAGDLLAGRFEVAAVPHLQLCSTCPGRGGLCSWPEEVTLRPLGDAA